MSRRGGRGGGQLGQKLDLIPTVPELYPSCSPPKPLNDSVNKFIPKYHEMIQYMLSNYKISNNNNPKKRDSISSFVVERYSDQYHAPLKLDARLTHSTDPRRLPQELGPSKKRIIAKKIKMEEIKAKKALERLAKLPDKDDEEEMEEGDTSPARKKIKLESGEEATNEATNEDDDDDEEEDDDATKKGQNIENDEEEEEVDEELDEGTDYASNWFDNGEGYGDSDEDNVEDTYS